MPDQVFLTEREPLVRKTARWLAGQASGRPLDLSTFLIVLPTAGAARRLRMALLEERPDGVLPPRMTTPMGLLACAAETEETPVASSADSLRAWAGVIATTPSAKHPLLLGGFPDLSGAAIRIAKSLTPICTILAEAGLTPSSPELLRASPLDEDRWREIESLYRHQLKVLEAAGLRDAQTVQLAAAQAGSPPTNVTRIIVAGVTDLSPLVIKYLTAVPVPVTVLTDAAGCDTDVRFDIWGRPDAKYWTQHVLPTVTPLFLSDPASESLAVTERLGPAALCVADPALVPHFQRTLNVEGRVAFDPAGTPLARFESAALTMLWLDFCRSERLTVLRALMEHPTFLRAFVRDAGLEPDDALAALDILTTRDLVTTLSDAPEVPQSAGMSGRARRLLGTIKKWRTQFDARNGLAALPVFLAAIHGDREILADSSEAAALSKLGDVLRALLDSPLNPASAGDEILTTVLAETPIYESHPEGAIELHGWLEAPWLPHDALVISGCTEGALPAQVNSHPFLPDSLRVKLGLPGNADRLARDIHQMHCLLAVRAGDAVQLTLSRTSVDGEPTRPSRLLFRCRDTELPARVRQLFGPPLSPHSPPPRAPAWQFRVRELPPPKRLSVTAFADYLDCPLRFYFTRLLKMESFDPAKSELDAMEFGEILHGAIEAFSKNLKLRDSADPDAIASIVLAALDDILEAKFGFLSLPVRVQRESLRSRLRQFAILQAHERAAGWRLVEAELEFSSEDTYMLSGLPITGKIDRVEVHDRTGERRILDYKTYQSITGRLPQDTHFAAHAEPDPDFPEAEFDWENKPRRWTQLQLPLYRALAKFRWPQDPAPARTGYFLLPEKTEDSGIYEFLADEEVFASAMRCAETIADRVRRGAFWPPRKPKYDNFDELFLGRDPADAMAPEAIRFLQGHRS